MMMRHYFGDTEHHNNEGIAVKYRQNEGLNSPARQKPTNKDQAIKTRTLVTKAKELCLALHQKTIYNIFLHSNTAKIFV